MGYVAFDNTRLEKNRVDFAHGLLLQTGSSNQTARTEYKSSDIRPTCISFIATSDLFLSKGEFLLLDL